jgi:hypothetical protein
LFGIAIALACQDAFAKNRLQEPFERPRCLKEKVIELSPACSAAAIAVASQVEHADVDFDVRLLLLSQSGRYKRQGGMEARPNRGVSGILE